MDFLNWLDQHPLVIDYDVLDHYDLDDATLLKLRLVLVDKSVLFTKEYVDETTRNYAFQWQTADHTWLMRWDNVPHFPKLASFPHHRHDYRQLTETVTDSYDITLSEVLTYIHSQLKNS
jgi:hypothetical protein